MKKILASITIAILAGCAGTPEWIRQDTSPAQTTAELADCQQRAAHDVQRDINMMSDTLASRALDWQRSGVLGIRLQEFAAEIQNRTSALVHRCMIDKGFMSDG